MRYLLNITVPTVKRILNDRGQTLIEYGLLLILIAVVVVATVTLVGQRSNNTWSTISSSMP